MSQDIIKLLPESVANQIAAGEVIQRPSAVVKELVENAVDAGATEIQIIIKDAGRTLIQVVDNGCGMSENDARNAFSRHATSKITEASDLFHLQTMGFRGEALASIAAIAQVDLRTMRRGGEIGTRIRISGSQIESQTPEACAEGCNIMVSNLFFNTPARRKFLKKDAVEMANIAHEFERLALVNTTISLTLIHNGATIHQLHPSSFKKRICELFGRNLEQQLIPIEIDTSMAQISGFISRPENCRRRNYLQYMTVNGRNMRHPYFHKAISSCYDQLIATDYQPNYFLNFTVDPETIDVNIHPQKHEIKFENEAAIYQIIMASIRETMGKFNIVPSIIFDTADAPDIPTFNPAFNQPSSKTTHAAESSGGKYRSQIPDSLRDWDKLYEGFQNNGKDSEMGSRSGIGNGNFNDALGLNQGQGSGVTMVPSKISFDDEDPASFQLGMEVTSGSEFGGIGSIPTNITGEDPIEIPGGLDKGVPSGFPKNPGEDFPFGDYHPSTAPVGNGTLHTVGSKFNTFSSDNTGNEYFIEDSGIGFGANFGNNTDYNTDSNPNDPWAKLSVQGQLHGSEQQTMSSQPQLIREEEVTHNAAFQFKNKYIITGTLSGLMVINQHRAHVRVLYEKYLVLVREGLMASQSILFPETFVLDAAPSMLLEDIAEDLGKIGFDLAYLGDRTWVLNGAPSVLPPSTNPINLITELCAQLADGEINDIKDRLNSQTALQMAHSAAVRDGKALTQQEIDNLIGDLLKLSSPTFTPDGLLVFSIIPVDQLSKMFE